MSNESPPCPNTALLRAAMAGDIATLQACLRNGADIDFRDPCQWSAAIHASGRGHADCLAMLIAEGCDIDAKNNHGFTPAALAALTGRIDCLRILARAGCDLQAAGNSGQSLLHLAAVSDNPECLVFLISLGAQRRQPREGRPIRRTARREALVASRRAARARDRALACHHRAQALDSQRTLQTGRARTSLGHGRAVGASGLGEGKPLPNRDRLGDENGFRRGILIQQETRPLDGVDLSELAEALELLEAPLCASAARLAAVKRADATATTRASPVFADKDSALSALADFHQSCLLSHGARETFMRGLDAQIAQSMGPHGLSRKQKDLPTDDYDWFAAGIHANEPDMILKTVRNTIDK